MFTGIIQDVGEVGAIDKQGDWTLTVGTAKLPLDRIAVGGSVACNGICLTVVEKTKTQFKVQVSAETLSRTTALHWRPGTRINLEPSLRAGDELGGHMVFGHVDGVARVVEKRREGDSLHIQFELPHEYVRFLAPKGSIAIDGVSMTVNAVAGPRFAVNIIPHTQGSTILAGLEAGGEANFEIDMLARYADRLLNHRKAA